MNLKIQNKNAFVSFSTIVYTRQINVPGLVENRTCWERIVGTWFDVCCSTSNSGVDFLGNDVD